MAIYLNRSGKELSIAVKLIIYFVLSGSIFFGAVLAVFLVNTEKFTELTLESVLNDIAPEVAHALYLDEKGRVQLDKSRNDLSWGFDALYSNLAYRVVEQKSMNIVLLSKDDGTEGYIFNGVTKKLPAGYSKLPKRKINVFRLEVELHGNNYYFDVARSNALADLASEAVQPAIVESVTVVIGGAFLLFLTMSLIAIKFIVKPAKLLSSRIEQIRAEDLEKRVDVSSIPSELLPIATAMNEALERVEDSFNHQRRFIADAAHELRTPLTIFLNRVELKLPPSEVKEELIDDASYLSRIVEQLLDLSRAQNVTHTDLTAVSIEHVVKSVCAILAPLAIDKSQELEVVVEDNNAFIHVDEGELSVIIKNLVENAIKHCPDEAKIRVSVFKSNITVEDSGSGISETENDLVFERFWRKDQSNRSGSGLGLSIIKELVSHYEASITVDNSSRFGGAKFTVRFD